MTATGVILIGPRGAGKTAVGALLASRMGLPFRDADAVVEQETGMTIPDLFAQGIFRAREVAVLARLLEGPMAVIAAGGGAVLWDGFADAARHWRVVWLDAPVEVLAARIAGSNRPSLTGDDIETEIGGVARERAALYAAASWKRIDTGRGDSETVAQRILELLEDEANASFDSAD